MSQFIYALCKMIMVGKNQCNFQGAIAHFVGTQRTAVLLVTD